MVADPHEEEVNAPSGPAPRRPAAVAAPAAPSAPVVPAGAPSVRPALAVVAALVFRAGRLLITQRRASDELGGLWEFPGGKLDPGETARAGLRRELREELGLEVRVGELVAEVTQVYPGRRVWLRFFRCGIVRGEPEPLDCAALAWVSAGELEQYTFPAADARLLARLRADLRLWRAVA